jgi:AraC-like DNA-binding protein
MNEQTAISIQMDSRTLETSLAYVAFESGFANESHLTRIFKRYLGLTPKGYPPEILDQRTFLS